MLKGATSPHSRYHYCSATDEANGDVCVDNPLRIAASKSPAGCSRRNFGFSQGSRGTNRTGIRHEERPSLLSFTHRRAGFSADSSDISGRRDSYRGSRVRSFEALTCAGLFMEVGMSKRTLWLLAASLGLASWVATVPLLAAQAPPATDQSSEVCATCHTDTADAFKSTPHAASEKGCAGCHGDAKAHVDAGGGKGNIRNFKSVNAADSSNVCMTCHNKGGQKHFTGSMHDSRNISCITCHNPHPAAGAVPKALLPKAQLELCTSCHLQKKAALMRSSHMPLREGKMTCTSCHKIGR